MRFIFALLLLLILGYHSFGASVRGHVTDENNKPLPFASIFVKNSKIGTNSNEKGEFSLALEPGKYEIVFRFLGYETQTRFVEISSADITLNLQLQPAVIQLSDAIVGKSKEDPALTIMRKTIAMSVFHYKELENYSFKTYLKGNLKNLPKRISLKKISSMFLRVFIR